jgi:hypothetical protein
MPRNVNNPPSWIIFQSNGINMNVTLSQDSVGMLSGVAATSTATSKNLTGQVSDDEFFMRVFWDGSDSVGNYRGTFGLDNRLSGTTFDETHPSSSATWNAGNQTFQ